MSDQDTPSNDIDRYAVFGNPISHSRSPQIHAAFAKQCDQRLTYEACLVAEDQFDDTVRDFFATGGKGLNITVPFKQAAYALADQLSERAQRAGAVNTLMLRDAKLYGDNTDGVGMMRDIVDNLGWTIKDKRVLILGAGGAVRGVLAPLIACQPAQLVIGNRTVSQAEALSTHFADLYDIQACAIDDLDKYNVDLIINGTSASLSGELPDLPAGIISTEGCCYDMMYSATPTIFMRWAQQHDVTAVADGLGMLVEQAAESFYLWRGVRPSTAPVIDAIRRTL